jgi:hypothetical protein
MHDHLPWKGKYLIHLLQNMQQWCGVVYELNPTFFDFNGEFLHYVTHLNKRFFHGGQWTWKLVMICRNPSFGLATKAKRLQGCGLKGSPGVTSGTPGSVGKREGVNPHTPKATPALGDGVPVDSQNFRDRFEGSNLNGLWRSLYQWKFIEA